jgi:hypothetical protein
LAKIKLFVTLDFYTQRNISSEFSKKLKREFNQKLKLKINNPEMGIKTDSEPIRGLIVGDFILFHKATPDHIIVHKVWDSRQNPESLKIK